MSVTRFSMPETDMNTAPAKLDIPSHGVLRIRPPQGFVCWSLLFLSISNLILLCPRFGCCSTFSSYCLSFSISQVLIHNGLGVILVATACLWSRWSGSSITHWPKSVSLYVFIHKRTAWAVEKWEMTWFPVSTFGQNSYLAFERCCWKAATHFVFLACYKYAVELVSYIEQDDGFETGRSSIIDHTSQSRDSRPSVPVSPNAGHAKYRFNVVNSSEWINLIF